MCSFFLEFSLKKSRPFKIWSRKKMLLTNFNRNSKVSQASPILKIEKKNIALKAPKMLL